VNREKTLKTVVPQDPHEMAKAKLLEVQSSSVKVVDPSPQRLRAMLTFVEYEVNVLNTSEGQGADNESSCGMSGLPKSC